MLRLARRAFAAGWILAAGPGLASAQTPAPPASATAEPPLQTPAAYGHSSVPHAAAAPLHDLNLVRQKIPPVLLLAMADPYARLVRPRCDVIRSDLADLDAALGPDFDEPNPLKDPEIKRQAKPLALSLVHGAAENLLPFHGYISTLSGAERHDALVLEAIEAGSTRRGYLKGLGEARGCAPPDAPAHLIVPAPPIEDTRNKPLYPIR